MILCQRTLLVGIIRKTLGEILAQDDMVAVSTLHDTADLAGVQGSRGVLKLRYHSTGGIDVAVGIAVPTGVLAVLICQLAEQRLYVLGLLELGQQVLGSGTLGLDLLLGEGFAGSGILGGQQDVIGIDGVLVVVLRSQVQGTSLLQHQIRQAFYQVGSGRETVKAVLADTQLLQVGLELLLAAQFLDSGCPVLLQGRLVLVGHLHAIFLGHILNGGVELDRIFRLLPGKLAHRGAFTEFGIPVEGTVLIEQLAIDAVIVVRAEDLIVDGVAVIRRPIEVQFCGDGVSIHLHDRLVGSDAGDLIVDAGGLLVGAAAGAEEDHGKRQQGADGSFHAQVPHLFSVIPPMFRCWLLGYSLSLPGRKHVTTLYFTMALGRMQSIFLTDRREIGTFVERRRYQECARSCWIRSFSASTPTLTAALVSSLMF